MDIEQLERPCGIQQSEADTRSVEQLIAAIREIRPLLQAQGERIEAARKIPDDVLQLVRDTGAFRMMMPRKWGGLQMNPMQLNAALEELAMGNGAVAWCVMIQIDSGQFSGFMPPAVAQKIYADPDATTSNVIRAAGRAHKVDDGYLVTGRWPFASGCLHADWFAGGCVLFDQAGDCPVLDGNGRPLHRMIIAPRDAFVIHDTWYTTGLRGTGSNDIEAKELFIPDGCVFGFEDSAHEGALYRWPAVICAKMPGVVFGIARSALEGFMSLMSARKPRSELLALTIADAGTRIASARAFVQQSLEVVWAKLEAGQQPDITERANVCLARANAFQSCRAAVQQLFDATGGAAIYERRMPLERHLRDLETACQHVFAQRRAQLAAGELLLGVPDVDFPFL